MEWAEEFETIEKLLDREYAEVSHVSEVLGVTRRRVLRGGIWGLHAKSTLERRGDNWTARRLAIVVNVDDFVRWVRENRPKAYTKIEAVLVDRSFRRGLLR